jgi:hypothetical protein
LYCCTGFWIVCGFFCVCFVNLRYADEYVIVLDNSRRLCACLCDYVLIQLFFTLLIVFYYSMLGLLIQLFGLFYFALYFGWLTVTHKTPSPGARRLKVPRADIVPVLGTTPGNATLLGKRPEGPVGSCEKLLKEQDSLGAPNTNVIFFKPPKLMAQFLNFQDERDPNGFMGIPRREHVGF